jgi:hypothetical protein
MKKVTFRRILAANASPARERAASVDWLLIEFFVEFSFSVG